MSRAGGILLVAAFMSSAARDAAAHTGSANPVGQNLTLAGRLLEDGDFVSAAVEYQRVIASAADDSITLQAWTAEVFHGRRYPLADEMVVFARCFDLLAWLMPKAEQFPRAYRFTVTQRLMDAALDLQERLVEAQSERDRERLAGLRAAARRLAQASEPVKSGTPRGRRPGRRPA